VPDGSRGILLTWVAAAVLATLAVVRLVGGGGDSSPPPVRIDGEASAVARQSAGGRPGGLFVHVAGAVRRPGLYRLPAAARVAEALQRAGGPLPRAALTAVNLAARIEDGQQVVVPAAGAGATAGVAPGAAGAPGGLAPGSPGIPGAPGVKLSLGAATVEQLEELDGIGPTLAERIIEYREANGGFSSLGQLREIEGIGEKRFASLREAVQP
jgi:competence protein ComEA